MRKRIIGAGMMAIFAFGFYICIKIMGQYQTAEIKDVMVLQAVGKGIQMLLEDAEENNAMVQEKEPERPVERQNRIDADMDNIDGNLLGYSLLRYPPGGSAVYERDTDYLLEEKSVGKGIFVSPHMDESEIFLGQILKETIEGRGTIPDEKKDYFTETGIRQMQEISWELLDGAWVFNPYAYDRFYEINRLYGEAGYTFSYLFYADREKVETETTQTLRLRLSVNGGGKICGVKGEILDEPSTERSGMEYGINITGLYDDTYKEIIIQNGKACEGKVLPDFEKYFKRGLSPNEVYEQVNAGLLESGDAAVAAEEVARILTDVMESRGANAAGYADRFDYEKDFQEFQCEDWERLGEGWKADEGYYCFYADTIRTGRVEFQYYFYPDYEAMDTEVAEAVIFVCMVGSGDGKLSYPDMTVFPMSREECRIAKQMQEKEEWRIPVVEQGQVLHNGIRISVPVADRGPVGNGIWEYRYDEERAGSYRREEREIWGKETVEEAAAWLGEKFLDMIEEGEIREEMLGELSIYDSDSLRMDDMKYFIKDGWKATEEYDCYHIRENECNGCIALRYYFYPEKLEEDQTEGKVLVIDVYVSEDGIEEFQCNEYRTKL